MPRNRKLASPFHYFNSSPEVIRKAAEVFGCNGDIRETLAGHITKAPLLEKLGDRISSDCTRLCDLVAVLPHAETFTSLDDMIGKLSDRNAVREVNYV